MSAMSLGVMQVSTHATYLPPLIYRRACAGVQSRDGLLMSVMGVGVMQDSTHVIYWQTLI